MVALRSEIGQANVLLSTVKSMFTDCEKSSLEELYSTPVLDGSRQLVVVSI